MGPEDEAHGSAPYAANESSTADVNSTKSATRRQSRASHWATRIYLAIIIICNAISTLLLLKYFYW